MSTIWTPGGERPVGGNQPDRAEEPPPPAGRAGGAEPTEAEMEAKMMELRRQLAETPAELVIANHAYGLFELAALHLSLTPPQLPQAQLAIDALGAVIEGLAGRLGEGEDQLKEGLTQLRLAFVQMKAGHQPS
ncbi:MAG TPA: hypothetical protein VNA57_06680 [Acidimicrobiales bacterium]|nr:hypothetical protein [Acidimicrobiales bacterium]